MGENEARPIVAAYVDGMWQSFGYLDELRNIRNETGGPGPDDPGPPGDPAILTDPVVITGRFQPAPRMSRRRFVKLLMSRGIPRNDAAGVAERARKAGWTYVDAWWAILLYNMK